MENGATYKQPTIEEQEVETDHKKCPACGGNMVFDPDSQMLYCSYCGTKQGLTKNITAQELSMLDGLSEKRNWGENESVVFSCSNCGAKVVLPINETATNCPFCGTAHVKKSEELAGLKPNGVLPFSFNIDKAIEYCKAWVKRRIFAPRKFKKNLGIQNLKGVYAPCFSFDSKTESFYSGRIGVRHTRVVGSGKNRRVETYIVWRTISGSYYYNFDDILITAGKKFDQNKLEKLQPYESNTAKQFDESYLLGFMAYHYDTDLADCWGLAKNKIDACIRKGILSQYSYDVVDFVNVSTTHSRVTYKYVMLPVYVGNFTYRKKLFNFYVNGNSGKVTGKTPKSPWRILFAVLLGLGIACGIGLLVYFLGGN